MPESDEARVLVVEAVGSRSRLACIGVDFRWLVARRAGVRGPSLERVVEPADVGGDSSPLVRVSCNGRSTRARKLSVLRVGSGANRGPNETVRGRYAKSSQKRRIAWLCPVPQGVGPKR